MKQLKRKAVNSEWNVVNNEDFKEHISFVFENVADALKNTLGPYGSTTIIEKFGEMHATKDGWQVLKKIHFSDTTSESIMQLLFNIAAQVVIKVGDGSTSSIMAANTVLQELESSDLLTTLRPKDFIDALTVAVGKICEYISETANKIDKEIDPEYTDIKRLAMISTNGDETVSSIIQEIYKATDNPSIEFVKGKDPKTTYEIVDGYKANISYIDSIFAQNEEGECNINKPLILMFNHKLERSLHLQLIIQPAIQRAIAENRRLVVIAPHYDKYLLEYLASVISGEVKATGTTKVVYCRASLINNMSVQLYNDFAVMAGATVIGESHLQDFYPLEEGEERELANVNDFLGSVEYISIGTKTTLISGFTNRNENMYNTYLTDARAKYMEAEIRHREFGLVNNELYDLKQRISKLHGKMGIISVGGYSSMEKAALYDLVEDAVKACESAYNYGYNMGGNLIIPSTIRQLTPENDTERTVFELLENAFRNVFKYVMANKYPNHDDLINETIEKSIECGRTYNLITGEYDANVINSCLTDIEILKATTSIISLLVSSNQFLSIKIER